MSARVHKETQGFSGLTIGASASSLEGLGEARFKRPGLGRAELGSTLCSLI